MSEKKRKTLIDHIQNHERVWGMDTYNNRPNLSDILKADVVVFWHTMGDNDNRPTITLHNDLSELEAYFSKLIFRSSVNPPNRRVYAIYAGGKSVRVKGVSVHFEVVEI